MASSTKSTSAKCPGRMYGSPSHLTKPPSAAFTQRGEASLTSSIEIEKLSCMYEGIAGAIQYCWKTSQGVNYGYIYGYIYAAGKGLVQVITHARR